VIRGNAHFCIAVQDLEKQLQFYCDVLGLHVTMDYTAPDGTRMLLLSPPGESGSGAYAVEVLRFPNPRSLPENHNAPEWLGFKHAAFAVTNLDELHQKLIAAGAQVRGEPRSPYEGVPRVLNCFDPEGNRLELVEVG